MSTGDGGPGPGTDPLAIAQASPAAVLRGDRAAWLELFTHDASVEDPVGAGAHRGRERLGAFWDAFIAPQQSIAFDPHRDFVHGEQVLRHVTIATVTPVAPDPFRIPAILEYRVQDGRIASLRAFWEPRHAVAWHASRGVRGLAGLLRHGARTTSGLGLGSALGFGRSLVPAVSHRRAWGIAEGLAHACGGEMDGWLALAGRAELSVAPFDGVGPRATEPGDAWERAIGPAPAMRPVEVIPAGPHVACVLEAAQGGPAACALVAVTSAHPRRIDLIFAR